jgi:hypothetical protein
MILDHTIELVQSTSEREILHCVQDDIAKALACAGTDHAQHNRSAAVAR